MDNLKKIKDRENTLNELRKRMDNARKLAYGERYELKDAFGKPIPGSVSVTDNAPQVLLNSVISWIMAAKWQTMVEGDISSTTERYIENFLKDAYLEADERLVRKGMQKVFPFIATHICGTGWIGGRVLWQKDDEGNIYADLLPMDMRYVAWENNNQGLAWHSNLTFRSSDDINSEYKTNIKPAKELEVRDYFDNEAHEVYVKDDLIFDEENVYGYPTAVIVPAPEGFLFLDKGYMVHEGEDIFFLDRDMYEFWNQTLSIDQTLALKAALPNWGKQSDNPATDDTEYIDASGALIKHKPGEKPELLDQPDINMSNRVSHQTIKESIQKGGASDMDLAVPPRVTSALWITQQEELRSKIVVPRLQAIESFYQQSSRMIIDQYIKGEYEGKLGSKGRKGTYSYRELADPDTYEINYKLMSESKQLKMAQITLSKAAAGELSRDTRIRHIMEAEDPEGEIAKLETEDAELDPVLKYMRMGYSAVVEAAELKGREADIKKLQSIALARTVVRLLRNPQPAQQEEPPQPRINLGEDTGLGGGNGAGVNAGLEVGIGEG